MQSSNVRNYNVWNVWIGLVDSNLKDQSFVAFTNPNVIYYSARAWLCGDSKTLIQKQGKGFRTGDKVTVKADMKKGQVIWEVNGRQQATYQWKILK